MRVSFRILLTAVALLTIVSALILCREPSRDGLTGRIAPSTSRQASDQDHAFSWFPKKRFTTRKGVALVIHGLNLKPERMGSIIAALNRAGVDVLNVSLLGHGDNYRPFESLTPEAARLETFRNVTYPIWRQEVRNACEKAKRRAAREKVPLFFVGYSLGGLLGCDLVLTDPETAFRRMVLFAPALNVKVEAHLLKVLSPFPNLVIDSLSPRWYRANDGTPMAAYRALFDAIGHVEGNAGPGLNVPTVVLIDKEDEFISMERIREFMTETGLSRWRILPVRKDENVAASTSHHLVIDEAAVGREPWKGIEKAIVNHLLEREADS
ncbi:MAG: alpha/beta fold hydrolase [Syntrophaceae bacterium]|nr:alpha/beta fold hydrolase [Syntrophaceae bacterium]